MSNRVEYKLLSPEPTNLNADRVIRKSIEQGLRRIQQLLSEWLRVKKRSFIATAGV